MPTLTFDEAYFTGGREYGYDDYSPSHLPFDYYADVIAHIAREYDVSPSEATVLIAGCALGYTVKFLRETYGTDAYGIDISQYAVDNAPAAISDRIIQGDITVKNDVKNASQLVSGKYNLILTEGVVCCLTDSEAADAGSHLRSECDYLAHRVWATDTSDLNNFGTGSWYTEHTLSEWQSIVDPDGVDHWDGEYDYHPGRGAYRHLTVGDGE